MCGIHGIVDRNTGPQEMRLLLQGMAAAQRHRGPDDQNEAIICNDRTTIGLGFVRLAILDLETGMQPIVSGQTGSTIVCNGQIYNYRTLRQKMAAKLFKTNGDIEVALHLYDEIGVDFLHQLNGMYAGAIYDPQKRQLLLFQDRFGIKPLYYANVAGRFIFASEIKALLKALPKPADVNRHALPLYLTFGYMPGRDTLFEHVHRLQPGCFLIYDIDTGSSKISSYWRYSPRVNVEMTVAEATDHLAGLLEDSVNLRMHADVPVGALISGGIDSSAVATLAEKVNPKVALYSVSFKNSAFDESASVAEFSRSWLGRKAGESVNFTICDRSSLDDLPDIISYLDEPLAKTSLLPTWQLFKTVGQNHKVVLAGEGADELFAGYGCFWLEPGSQRQKTTLQPLQFYMDCRRFFTEKEIGILLNTDIPEIMLDHDLTAELTQQHGPLETLLQFESRCRLPASNLLRVDKLAMAHSVEVRTPFLDYRIGEFAATLPPDLKLGSCPAEQKYVLRETFRRNGILSPQASRVPKQPFCAPIDDWLRETDKLPEYMLEIMEFNHPLFEDIIDPREAKRMTQGFLGDATTPFTNVTKTDRFWNLCVLALWYGQMKKNY